MAHDQDLTWLALPFALMLGGFLAGFLI